jgi:hypothetical protein
MLVPDIVARGFPYSARISIEKLDVCSKAVIYKTGNDIVANCIIYSKGNFMGSAVQTE